MPVIESQVNTESPDFTANAEAMRALVADLDEKLAEVRLGGGDDARVKHLKREKMLPRDRISMLVDHGSEFLELSALAACDMPQDHDRMSIHPP